MKLARWEPFKEAEDFFRQFGVPMFGRWPSVGGKDGVLKVHVPKAASAPPAAPN